MKASMTAIGISRKNSNTNLLETGMIPIIIKTERMKEKKQIGKSARSKATLFTNFNISGIVLGKKAMVSTSGLIFSQVFVRLTPWKDASNAAVPALLKAHILSS